MASEKVLYKGCDSQVRVEIFFCVKHMCVVMVLHEY